MVLFEVLCLLLTIQKKWFWAGFSGSLALLVWQPMAAFPFVTFLLAVLRPGEERRGAILRAAGGIVTPLVAILAYYYYEGALNDLINGFFLFNVLYLVRGGVPDLTSVQGEAGNVIFPYGKMLAAIVVGFVMILRLYLKRPLDYRSAPVILSLPAPILWSVNDFQLADDFFVFLPYAAIGFGAFLDLAVRRAGNPRLVAGFLGAILLGIAVANTFDAVDAEAAYRLKGTQIGLAQQREGAAEVKKELGRDAKLVSINSPQLLVLLHKRNPNPYIFITAGVDREIAAQAPGGFEGWMELGNWLGSRYQTEKIGPWWLFVKKGLSTTGQRASLDPQQEAGSSTG